MVLTGLGSMAMGGAYAGVIEPYWRLQTTRYQLTPPNWPAHLPLRIAAIADPHINRPYITPSHMARVSQAVMAAKPDLIVLLGDYLSSLRFTKNSLKPAEIANCFADLNAPLGVYAILGNHDWWEDPDGAGQTGNWPPVIARELMAIGIPVLENEALRLDQQGQPFWLMGLGDQWSRRPGGQQSEGRHDLPGTMAQLDDETPAILLAHEPDIFPQVSKRVALTLCGHTHGGQVVMAGYAPKVPSLFGQRYRYGHIVEEDRHLIVSAGIGMGGGPVRFGIPPEIVIVDLGR